MKTNEARAHLLSIGVSSFDLDAHGAWGGDAALLWLASFLPTRGAWIRAWDDTDGPEVPRPNFVVLA